MENKKTLIDFLKESDVTNITKKIIVSKRLSKYPFTIKALSLQEINNIRNSSTLANNQNKINLPIFVHEMILTALVEPNFRNVDVLNSLDVLLPEMAIDKFLLAGEQEKLIGMINNLSGYKNETELIAEAKN